MAIPCLAAIFPVKQKTDSRMSPSAMPLSGCGIINTHAKVFSTCSSFAEFLLLPHGSTRAFNSFMSVIKTLMLIQLCTGVVPRGDTVGTLPADTRVHKNAVATHVLSARLLCTLPYAAGRGPRI